MRRIPAFTPDLLAEPPSERTELPTTLEHAIAVCRSHGYGVLRADDYSLHVVRAETERLRAELDDGNAAATKHLNRLRELAWNGAPKHLSSSPGWSSGEECLDALAAELDRLRAEAEGAIVLSDEQMAAVKAVLRRVRACHSDALRADQEMWTAVLKWERLGCPLLDESEGTDG
jgi:NAD(P)H-dependent flavin oxidoreductase YrpB (nitropropane dioxygenase family)